MAKRPTLREWQKDLTRERILDAALEVFEKVGFRDATVDQIAQAAAINRATLYLHYKDKFHIARGLAIRAISVMSNQFDRLSQTRPASRVEVRGIVEEMYGVYRQHATLFAVTHVAMLNNKPLLEMHRKIADRSFAPIADGLPPKAARKIRDRAMLLYYMQDRAFYLLSSGAPADMMSDRELVETVADLWWTGLFAAESNLPAPRPVSVARNSRKTSA